MGLTVHTKISHYFEAAAFIILVISSSCYLSRSKRKQDIAESNQPFVTIVVEAVVARTSSVQAHKRR